MLRSDIIEGRLSVGEQLKQDQLCNEFSLSPAPVREALRELESEGLVTHVANRGVFVAEITSEDVFDLLLPVRLIIEQHAVTKAATRLTAEELADLEDLVVGMEEAARAGQLSLINELDMRFHEVTVQASGSVQALQLWHSVEPRIRAQIYFISPRHVELAEIADEHRRLLEAISKGDEPELRRLIEEHIIGTNRDLLGTHTGAETEGRSRGKRSSSSVKRASRDGRGRQ